jgi:hypothetical protein
MFSTILGCEDCSAIAGIKSFRYARQYESPVWSGGKAILSIAFTKAPVDATTCITALKKQVFPMFLRVQLKR